MSSHRPTAWAVQAVRAVPAVLAGCAVLLSPAAVPSAAAAGPPADRSQQVTRADTSCRQAPQEGVELPDTLPGRPLADRLGLAQAWDLADGTGITVGVVDSGVDHRHPELTGAVAAAAEFVTVQTAQEYLQQTPEAPHLDCEGHGTAVAGLIAARRGGETRITGVAPGARVLPVRVVDGVDSTSAGTLAAGIDHAVDSGAKVLNLSFASPVDRPPIRKAVQRAVNRDVVVVAAAGNEGNEDGTKMYPAAYDGVIAVGAVDADGLPLSESNSGDWVDLAAYGGDEIVLASGGSGYRQVKGTSFAAPQVSGAAALVRSRFPALSAGEVTERLLGSASPVGGGQDGRTGAGIVDPFGALTLLDGGGQQPDGAGPARPGAIPVQAVPHEEPLLSATAATAVAWSGGLLLAVLLALLGSPMVLRAMARGRRPGPVGGDRPRPTVPGRGPNRPAAALDRLTAPTGEAADGSADPHRTPHRPNSTR